MDKNKVKTVERLIRDKSKAQLKGLIVELCEKFSDAYEHILHWGKGTGGVDINNKLAFEYWEKAENIIGEFNSYGGGSEYEENEAYGYIESISELIPSLSWTTRQKILDGMLVQYHYGNSGFDDALTDACFQMCNERDEWLYLAGKLESYGGSWDKKLVMNIYRIIGDDASFLEMRNKNLHYGSDYFELVQYYTEKGDMEKSLSYAHKGLEKGEGRIDHLVAYLFDYYEGKRQIDELEKLFAVCEQRKQEHATIAGRLFDYYKAEGDYENAKKCLLNEFEYIGSRGLDKHYGKVRDYLNDSDWKLVEHKLFTALKTRNIEGYLHICLEKGLKQEIYDIITEKATRWGADYDYFADKLKKDFPEKIIEYYFKLAINLVEGGANRKSYKQSMKYFKKAKEIYLKVLKDKLRWEAKLAEIRGHYKTRRAFLEESRVLD